MKIIETKQGKWGSVQIDGFGDFEGLAGIEELKDYEIQVPAKKRKGLSLRQSKLNRKKKKKSVFKVSDDAETKRKRKIDVEKEQDREIEPIDVLPWTNIFVPEEIAKSLVEQGFMQPTEIQSLCIPAAIKGRRDILGAAETGSGKTLAFGIPMLHGIMKNFEKENTLEDSLEEEEEDDNEECVKVVHFSSKRKEGNLIGLVLAPTRELALQVRNHLEIAAKYTPVKIAAVVGGMSIDKQIRILKKKPHLLIATPGRLWELMNLEEKLVNLNNIRFFAIDETDRMLEKYHFPELRSILEVLQDLKGIKRQNFVFSATLTLVHEPPSYIIRKKRKKSQLRQSDKLNNLIKVIGMMDYKIVDITNKTGTAKTLKEAKISCTFEEKDYYVYYLLKMYSGKTIIFCNSISCVRRLASVLNLLSCAPIPLHANMQQKQRLKNLDRFRKQNNSILLSTDVAARGLDIPNVDHVIHYQVPRTSEGYIHRSGRTARADNTGVTILFIEPSEIKNYLRICTTLGREKDLEEFPIEQKLLTEAKVRVKIARDIDIVERRLSKIKSNSSWIEKSAQELDIILDDEQIPEKLDNKELAAAKRQLMVKKNQLSKLLLKPFITKGPAVSVVGTQKNSVKNAKLLKKKKLFCK